MTMELPTALLPQANTIGLFGVFCIFNETVLKDSVSGDLWADIFHLMAVQLIIIPSKNILGCA